MLKNCEITEKYQMYIKNNDNLYFGIRIEKENLVFIYKFLKSQLNDINWLIDGLSLSFECETFETLSYYELGIIKSVLIDFKKELEGV